MMIFNVYGDEISDKNFDNLSHVESRFKLVVLIEGEENFRQAQNILHTKFLVILSEINRDVMMRVLI